MTVLLIALVKLLLLAWLVASAWTFFRESSRAETGQSDLIQKSEPLLGQLVICAFTPPFWLIWFVDELHRRWKVCAELEAKK